MPKYKVAKFTNTNGQELKVYMQQDKHVHESFQNAVITWLNANRGVGWSFRPNSFQIVTSEPSDGVEYDG